MQEHIDFLHLLSSRSTWHRKNYICPTSQANSCSQASDERGIDVVRIKLRKLQAQLQDKSFFSMNAKV